MPASALIILNPNSSQSVTDGIAEAVVPLSHWGIPIRCETLADGPAAIESQAQAEAVVAPLLARCVDLEPQALGFVIACFGDPGVAELRAQTALPVVGIQEAAFASALSLGQRFGVISILEPSIPRHLAAIERQGLTGRLAGDRALGLGVLELADEARTLARMSAIGTALRDEDGADVLILGCAGMARLRGPLEDRLAMPVIDPCQAGAALALSRIALDQTHAPKGATHAG